jgi:branched-chain amino acid aminotransferase
MMPSAFRHTIQVFPNGAQPQIDPGNRAFKYGDGLFETILLYQGKPLNFAAHMHRLLHGAAVLGYDLAPPSWNSAMADALVRLRVEFPHPWIRLRVQVWRQSEGHFSPIADTVMAQATAEALPDDPWRAPNALRLMICHDIPLSESPLSAVKSCSALPYVYAARQAQRAGFDDAFLRSAQDGGIAEASAANCFLVRGANLWTPPLRAGCLPGTVRAEVIAAAQQTGFQIQERRIDFQDLAQAEEIFLTNAVRGLIPVAQVEGSSFAPRAHATTDHLRHYLRVQRGMPT